MTRLIFVTLFFIPVLLKAQMENCHDLSSTEAFASLASDETFSMAHDEPDKFYLQDRLGENIIFATPDDIEGTVYFIEAEGDSKQYLFVIHEWWGLNDHIRQEAEKLYRDLDNVNVMALDLYDGSVAESREMAGKLMQAVDEERAKNIIKGALNYAGDDADIATIGWCFGGGWSLQATILADEQAAGCVMYYGMPVKSMNEIREIDADVLGIFASQDEWITPEVVDTFEKKMQQANRDINIKMYDAAHAFANPSNPQYDEQAAENAYELTLNFLKSHLD